jgi:putative serine protease PepD
VSVQGVAEGQRFCQRCGTELVRSRCPLHGFDVSTSTAAAFPSVAGAAVPRPPGPRPIHNYATTSSASPPWIPPASQPAWTSPPNEPATSVWQPAPPPAREESHTNHQRSRSGPPSRLWLVVGLAGLLLIALIGDHFYLQSAADSNHRALSKLNQSLAAQLAATNALAGKVGKLENKSDPAAVAALVRASVYTIDTPDGLGSGWVVGSAGGTSNIVTDYHVIQSVWVTSGAHTVQVKQDTKTLMGTITKVDQGDDLAIVTVKATLTALPRSTTNAMVGDAVLVVGSPLGLSGTVANGIVSSFRNGLIQFSAPISPGDSGGPVVNQQGQVIGVAESKLVGSGVEGLSFAIPITTVCSTVTTC